MPQPELIDREALRQLAVAAVPEVAGLVVETTGALPGEDPPFIVMVVETDTRDDELLPPRTLVTFYSYIEPTSFVTLDHMVGELVTGLDQKKFVGDGGVTYLLSYDGTPGQDIPPDERGLIGRAVRFTVESAAYASALTYDPDPVTALAAHVAAYYPAVQTDPDGWSPSDANPGVFWRVEQQTGAQPLGPGILGSWFDVTMVAHVVAPTVAATREWTRRLVELLGTTDEVAMGDESPMFVQPGTTGAHEATRRVGQVRVPVRFGVLRPELPGVVPADPIEHIYGSDDAGDLLPATPTELTTAP